MRILAVFVSLLLASCANIEAQAIAGPNGKTAYTMKCTGGGRTMDACKKKAAELCPTGYNTVNSVVDPMSTYFQDTLAIECK